MPLLMPFSIKRGLESPPWEARSGCWGVLGSCSQLYVARPERGRVELPSTFSGELRGLLWDCQNFTVCAAVTLPPRHDKCPNQPQRGGGERQMFRSVLSTDLRDLPVQVGSSVSSGPALQAGGQCVF